MTTNEFIDKARKVHGNKYDYSNVEYKTTHEKVIIICPIHGEFEQEPSSHLSGCGCRKCVGTNKKDTKSFIKDAQKVHGKKYDYSKTEYKNDRTKLLITCNKHGYFWQTPNNHLSGKGCPMCKFDKSHLLQKDTTESFIIKAEKIHGKNYDYSKVVYKNNNTKVTIICPIHGEFEQLPLNHLQGKGCQKCNYSHLEKEMSLLLEKHKIDYEVQKTFDWLTYKGKLRLDFYLPKYNVAIECQGGQHFNEVKHFGGKDGFLNRQKLDKVKLDLCNSHNIKILYYTKTNINENFYFHDESIINKIKEINNLK